MTRPRILVIDDDYGRYAALQKNLIAKIDPAGRCEFSFCSGQNDGRNSCRSFWEQSNPAGPTTGHRKVPPGPLFFSMSILPKRLPVATTGIGALRCCAR